MRDHKIINSLLLEENPATLITKVQQLDSVVFGRLINNYGDKSWALAMMVMNAWEIVTNTKEKLNGGK